MGDEDRSAVVVAPSGVRGGKNTTANNATNGGGRGGGRGSSRGGGRGGCRRTTPAPRKMASGGSSDGTGTGGGFDGGGDYGGGGNQPRAGTGTGAGAGDSGSRRNRGRRNQPAHHKTQSGGRGRGRGRDGGGGGGGGGGGDSLNWQQQQLQGGSRYNHDYGSRGSGNGSGNGKASGNRGRNANANSNSNNSDWRRNKTSMGKQQQQTSARPNNAAAAGTNPSPMSVIVQRVDLIDGYSATGGTPGGLLHLAALSEADQQHQQEHHHPPAPSPSQQQHEEEQARLDVVVAPYSFVTPEEATNGPARLSLERAESVYADAVTVHVDEPLEASGAVVDVGACRSSGEVVQQNDDYDFDGDDVFVDAVAVAAENAAAATATGAAAAGGGGSGLDSFFDSFAPAPSTQEPTSTTSAGGKKHRKNKNRKSRPPQVAVISAPSSSIKVKRCSAMEDLSKDRHIANPYPPDVVHDKYWAQRRRLFSRFDEGIQLDGEGWFSVTPEAIADHVARRMGDVASTMVETGVNGMDGIVILDAFCGCGGNAVAFGKLSPFFVSLVICVDLDRDKLRMAAHNANIYGIPKEKIIFIHANTLMVLDRCYKEGDLTSDNVGKAAEAATAGETEECEGFTIGGIELLPPKIHAVFIDPPWGGVDYGSLGKSGYDLAKHMQIQYDGAQGGQTFVDGARLLQMAASATKTKYVVYDIPRNTNKVSLGRAALAAGHQGNLKLEEYYLNGRLKTITAYMGQDYSGLVLSRGGWR